MPLNLRFNSSRVINAMQGVCRWVAAATIVLDTKFMAMLEDWHIMVQLSQPGLSRPCLCAARARLTRWDQEQFMAAWSYFSFAEDTSNILNPVYSMFFPKLSAPHKSQVFLHQAAMTSSVDAALLHKVRSGRAEQPTAVWRPDDESWKCENVKRLGFRDIFPGQSDTCEVVEVQVSPRCFEDLTVGYQSYTCFSYRLVDARRGSLHFFQDPRSKGCKWHQLFQRWHHW